MNIAGLAALWGATCVALTAIPAHAQDCLSVDAMRTAATDHGLVVHEMSQPQLTLAAKAWNASPPQSDDHFSDALWAVNHDGDVVVLWFERGCATHRSVLSEQDLRERVLLGLPPLSQTGPSAHPL